MKKKIESGECNIVAGSERAVGDYGHAIFSEGNDHDALDTETFGKLRMTAERSVIAKRFDRRVTLQELLSQYVLPASAVARRSIALMKRQGRWAMFGPPNPLGEITTTTLTHAP